MGNRREPRTETQVAVRIFGTDSSGRIFSEQLSTVDVSREGVQLAGLKAQVKPDDVVGITYGKIKGRFRVRWVGPPETPEAGHIGLQNMAPENVLWDFPLPAPAPDNYRPDPKAAERRRHPRMKCSSSVELHPEEGALIWGKTGDLSVGGCFVEMPIPLKTGTKLKIGLWIEQSKVWAAGTVTTSTPGFGVGIRFDAMTADDTARLQKLVANLKQTGRRNL
ncbi:MAG: PilZ domain-containing protein [Acidobacteriales bacterium]|nr:PilZ domain-containing protein [Terriglobales bacterium]